MKHQKPEPINILRVLIFYFFHFIWIAIFFIKTDSIAIAVGCSLAFATICVQTFCLTAGYHRLFSHSAYKCKRWFENFLMFTATRSFQGRPGRWIGVHVEHHAHTDHCDEGKDLHSPKCLIENAIARGVPSCLLPLWIAKPLSCVLGFLESHHFWFLRGKGYGIPDAPAAVRRVEHLRKNPFFKFCDDNFLFPPITLGATYFLVGLVIGPLCGSTSLAMACSMLLLGFFFACFWVNNVTNSINSLSHLFGKRPLEVDVVKRVGTATNNWLLALLTFGEGWHWWHHYYQASVRQGVAWWHIDITYYILLLARKFGWASDFKYAPKDIMSKVQIIGQQQP